MKFRKPTPAGAALAVVALAVSLALVPAALAGKGGAGTGGKVGGGTLSLVMIQDANSDGLPNWGDTVTFNVSTTATSQPVVSLSCYQNGSLVFSSSAGFYPDYAYPWLRNFILSSTAWSSGAATCTATLEYYNGKRMATLATLSFPVYA